MIVVSFYAERRDQFPDAPDYRPFLAALDASAKRFGCRHVCITDAETAPTLPCQTFVADLTRNLMTAIICGQLAWLRSPEFDADAVLVGADCLVNRDPRDAFGKADPDMIVTSRPDPVAPVNNGAVYIRHRVKADAIDFYARALDATGEHWGGDQEAVGKALAPVPAEWGIYERAGMRVLFGPMVRFNHAVKDIGEDSEAFVVHFKGARKAFMLGWAARCVPKTGAVIRSRSTAAKHLAPNIRASAARVAAGLPVMAPGGHEGRPALIVGTGPSLADPEVQRRIREVVAAGAVVFATKGAPVALADMDVRADYAVSVDGQPNQPAKTPLVPGVTHLLASCCHPALFDHVLGAGHRVEVFHSGCMAYDPETGEAEGTLYARLFPAGMFIAELGTTVVNRALGCAWFKGCSHYYVAGADFGVRGDVAPGDGDRLAYAPGTGGFVNPGLTWVSDNGAIDGRPWQTSPGLIWSAMHIAAGVRAGHVTILGDSVAAGIAAHPSPLTRWAPELKAA